MAEQTIGYSQPGELFGGAGGGGGGGGYGGGTSGQYGPLAGQTYYADPGLAQSIIKSLQGPITQTAGMLPGYLQNPTASPAFQNTIQGLLSALAPSEAASRTALSDQARAAGNLSSGAYGVAGANLEGDIMRNRGELASKTLLSTMGPTIQAILGALGQGPQLLEAMRLSQQYRAPSSGGTAASSTGTADALTKALSSGSGVGGYGSLPSSSNNTSSSDIYSPLNPGTTEAEKSYYSKYGELPNANPFNNPNYVDPYAGLGSTTFTPGGNYVSVGSQGGGAPSYTPPAPDQGGQYSEWTNSMLTPPPESSYEY